VECGWGKKGIKQVKNFSGKHFSIVISDVKFLRMDKENNLLHVPMELFLLMG